MLMFHLDSGSDMMSDEKLMSLKLNRSFHHLSPGRGKEEILMGMEIISHRCLNDITILVLKYIQNIFFRGLNKDC